MLKIIIAGSRTYTDYKQFKNTLETIFPKLQWEYSLSKSEMQILSGHANGVDKMGERFAKENGIPCVLYPAKWDDLSVSVKSIKTNTYGKEYNALAGLQRNEKMRKELGENGILIAFWDGESRGTAEMIKECKKKNVRTFLVRIDKTETQPNLLKGL